MSFQPTRPHNHIITEGQRALLFNNPALVGGCPKLFQHTADRGEGVRCPNIGLGRAGCPNISGNKRSPHPLPLSLLPCQESSYTGPAQNYQLSSTVEPTATQKDVDSMNASNIYVCFHYLLAYMLVTRFPNSLSEINFHKF